MSAASIATVISAVIAGAAAFLSAWYAQRSMRAARVTAAEDSAVRFREPLLQAAFNLQTRLYNIARMDFLPRFEDSPRPGDREYAVDNTLYLVGQYFGWVEVVRRESQFLDPRSRENERAVADRIERVRGAFASSEPELSTELRIFRGQQRALGEVMLEPIAAPQAGCPRWDCMGYACFTQRVMGEPLARWFQPLRSDLARMRDDPGAGMERLVMIQHELLALIQLLDPEAHRTSDRLRERL